MEKHQVPGSARILDFVAAILDCPGNVYSCACEDDEACVCLAGPPRSDYVRVSRQFPDVRCASAVGKQGSERLGLDIVRLTIIVIFIVKPRMETSSSKITTYVCGVRICNSNRHLRAFGLDRSSRIGPAGILDAVFSGGFKDRRNDICRCYIGYLKFDRRFRISEKLANRNTHDNAVLARRQTAFNGCGGDTLLGDIRLNICEWLYVTKRQ
jgi:hypothetical protein